MSNADDVKRTLVAAAEAIIKRKLTDAETNALVIAFNEATGTYHDKALQALSKQAGLTTEGILKEARATTDTDRKMKDLQDAINNWGK